MYLWFQFGVARPCDAYLVVRRVLGRFRVIGRDFAGPANQREDFDEGAPCMLAVTARVDAGAL
jgi:hypothetical protein